MRIAVTTRHQRGCEPDLTGTILTSKPEQLSGTTHKAPEPCPHHPNCETTDEFGQHPMT